MSPAVRRPAWCRDRISRARRPGLGSPAEKACRLQRLRPSCHPGRGPDHWLMLDIVPDLDALPRPAAGRAAGTVHERPL